jgi:NADH:ubiquinone oxidoreductase subunit 6 (subunit J)
VGSGARGARHHQRGDEEAAEAHAPQHSAAPDSAALPATSQLAPGLIVGAGLFVILTATALRTQWAGTPRPPAPTTEAIGRLFMGHYLLPFETASILLLVALVGAAMIVRRRRDA